jgi:hypothetical protein
MKTLDYILNKYDMDGLQPAEHIEIPNVDRGTLASTLHELDFKSGVEIGVQRGYYSEVLCKENPQMQLYGVDPWGTYLTCKAFEEKGVGESWFPQELSERYYEETKIRLAPYPNYKIIRKNSMGAIQDFKDGSLDFVYIDGDHEYNHVLEDITEWSKKLRVGGIISGHDYYKIRDNRALCHVKEAVHDYIRKNNIKPLIIWGTNAKFSGEKRDKMRSWSWVKQ